MKAARIFLVTIFILSALSVFGAWSLLGPVSYTPEEPQVFTVPDNTFTFSFAHELAVQGLIRNETAFWWYDFLFGPSGDIRPGGYRIRRSMNAREILAALHASPQLVWVDIRAGIRKEQIGEVLRATLGWDEAKQTEWADYAKRHPELEGRFLSGTYLLPTDEPATKSASVILDGFAEKIQPLQPLITQKQVSLNTVLTIASLIQREAAGSHDMALISGIIWNRIHKNMRLDIDATLQYIKGNAEDGWWQRVRADDKFADSPYNTYQHPGLPPYPIASPGMAAIHAALNPVATDCLFYLHGKDREIHCAETYAEHKKNIETYLL